MRFQVCKLNDNAFCYFTLKRLCGKHTCTHTRIVLAYSASLLTYTIHFGFFLRHRWYHKAGNAHVLSILNLHNRAEGGTTVIIV